MLEILCVLVLTMLICSWFMQRKPKQSSTIPGPPRFPIVGNIFQLAAQSPFPSIALQKMSKTYGDVFSVKLGVVDAVVFNSFESVQEIMNHENGAFRSKTIPPLMNERMNFRNLGLIFSSGNLWVNVRRFTIRTLREFGFGKAASMDIVIEEEIEKFMTHLSNNLSRNNDGSVQVSGLFDLTIINVIWRLVTGKNYAMNDQSIARLLKLSNDMVLSTTFSVDIFTAFPALWHMFPRLSGKNRQMKIVQELKAFCQETVEQHRQSQEYVNNPQCYVDAFLQKIDENVHSDRSEYSDEQLVLCLLDLFQAGSETSSKTLGFSILYMLLYRDIQRKVQKEIDEVLGENEEITIATRSKLPFTHATILETLRFSSILPFAPVREAAEDFYFRKFVIKKGTSLMTNLEAVHFSEEVWGDPHTFRPERFLIKDSNVVDMKLAGKLMPFGGGKRICLGQNLAESMIFKYFATILKRFELAKIPGDPDPSVTPLPGLTYSPRPYSVRFLKRKQRE